MLMRRSASFLLSSAALVIIAQLACAEARLTRIANDVKVLRPSAPPRAAAANEILPSGVALETGASSQADVRFDNGALVRLGSNSVFAFTGSPRRMGLARGAMLVRAPRGAGEVRVATGKVTSVVGGTTALVEHYPEAYIKLISVEGRPRMFMRGKLGESVLLEPGQLMMFHTKPAPKSLPNPVDIDIQRLMATSLLIKDLPPLGNEASIVRGAKTQSKQKSDGTLADTNLVIYGRGTLVSLVPPGEGQVSPTPTPSPKAKR